MRDYEFYYTQDGSIGLYSYADDDVYHSKYGALSEAWEKFVMPSGIANIINKKENIKILDICYGIGYNTKSLMTYIINNNENFLKKENFLEKFLKKIFKKNIEIKDNTETIDTNNIKTKKEILSEPIETIKKDIISNYQIDCLEIKDELVKISPLLKTVITPQEIFSRIIPKIFDCFDLYWIIRKKLSKFSLLFAPKNKKEIKELLDLKFKNDYNDLKTEYRIHKFVNYIIVDKLLNHYKNEYITPELKKILSDKKVKPFLEPALINYALLNQKKGYKLITKFNLTDFLHNIYYDHLSNRYKKAKYKEAKSLFKLNFYLNDARKSILEITTQYDLIFLDAFTFSKAPELWSVEFIAELYRRLTPQGFLITYSNSALVRNTLIENNFYVGKIIDKNTGKSIGTIATKEKNIIEIPLSNYELGLCSTRAGIPYRDPTLTSTKENILKQREIEFKTSDLMTSSQYMRFRTSKNGEINE